MGSASSALQWHFGRYDLIFYHIWPLKNTSHFDFSTSDATKNVRKVFIWVVCNFYSYYCLMGSASKCQEKKSRKKNRKYLEIFWKKSGKILKKIEPFFKSTPDKISGRWSNGPDEVKDTTGFFKKALWQLRVKTNSKGSKSVLKSRNSWKLGDETAFWAVFKSTPRHNG